ncbi:hypothetical protein FHY12_000897 [Xanthomonas arboricola]|nr:hypothetical protein [Xanthomonas euroxanthea]
MQAVRVLLGPVARTESVTPIHPLPSNGGFASIAFRVPVQ